MPFFSSIPIKYSLLDLLPLNCSLALVSLHWETVAIIFLGYSSSGFGVPSFERDEHWFNLIARVITKDGITRISVTRVFSQSRCGVVFLFTGERSIYLSEFANICKVT